MKLYAHVLFVALALHARAATIPEELPEKLNIESPAELSEGPIENISVEKELPDQSSVVKDEESQLSVKTIQDIPVKVIVEDVPVVKTLDEDNEISPERLKKICEEIKDPGTPQRQEHETQNPEHHVDGLTLKQTVEDVQYLLKKEFLEFREQVNSFVTSNDNINSIKTSIESLQTGFNDQIQTLKAAVTKTLNPQSVEVQENVPEAQIKENLQILETKFNGGINNLKSSVEAVSLLKADNNNADGSSSTASETSTQSQNPLMQAWNNFQNTWNSTWTNFVQNINGGNQNQAATPEGAQSDTDATTQGPFQNIFGGLFTSNPNSEPNRPFQNLFQQFFGQSTTAAPSEGGQDSKPSENKEPVTADSSQPEQPVNKPEGEKNTGPIRQILERTPIIKEITGAVQRLQQNINNREKPRDTVNTPQVEPEKVEPVHVEAVKVESEKLETEKTDKEKGLFYGPVHGGNHGSSGDNIDIGSGLKEEAVKEESPEIPKDEPVPVQEKTEQVVV